MRAPPIRLDVTETLSSGLRTGIQRVTIELAREVVRGRGELIRFEASSGCFVLLDEEETRRLFEGPADPPPVGRSLPKPAVVVLGWIKDLVLLASTRFWSRAADPGAGWAGAVYLSAEVLGNAARAKAVRRLQTKVPTILMFHDLFPLTHPRFSALRPAAFSRHWSLALSAARVVAVSRHTAGEARRLAREHNLGMPPLTVGHPGHTPASGQAEAPVSFAEERFFLCVGTLEYRKNQEGLLLAHQNYRKRGGTAALVLVGSPGPGSRKLVAALGAASSRGVCWLGRTTDEELEWLYRRAEALVYPSRAEGFGLPLVEALALGTPCVTSDRTSTAEIANDYGGCLVVDPESDQLTEALCRFETPGYRASLAATIKVGDLPTWAGFFSTVEQVCRG